MSTDSKSFPCVPCANSFNLPGLSSCLGDDPYFNFGIPICQLCGGLGIIFDDPEFEKSLKEIKTACDEYYPSDGLGFYAHAVVRLKALKTVAGNATRLYKKFGNKVFPSFAKKIANGYMSEHIQNTEKQVAEIIALLEQAEFYGKADPCLAAKKTAACGYIEEAHGMFKWCVEKHPDNSDVAAGYAEFLLFFKRDAKASAKWYVEATKRQPQKVAYFMDAVQLLVFLGRDFEARNLLMQSLACPDVDSVPELNKVLKNLPTDGTIN